MTGVMGIDVWEGNPNLDESLLKAAGIAFMIIRLNDMNGGHHIDANFDTQWEQAAPFIHWPYFVYNPWVSGSENYDWLALYMPEDAAAVSVDIEVRKTGLSPAEYALQVAEFLRLAGAQWHLNIYTGAWFAAYLSIWPSNIEYWWARYPYMIYPPQRVEISWSDLIQKLNALPWSPGTTPGTCRLWQCTADRYILPGCGGTCVDINLWNGSLDELAAWAQQPVILSEDWEWSVTRSLRQLGFQIPDPECI